MNKTLICCIRSLVSDKLNLLQFESINELFTKMTFNCRESNKIVDLMIFKKKRKYSSHITAYGTNGSKITFDSLFDECFSYTFFLLFIRSIKSFHSRDKP